MLEASQKADAEPEVENVGAGAEEDFRRAVHEGEGELVVGLSAGAGFAGCVEVGGDGGGGCATVEGDGDVGVAGWGVVEGDEEGWREVEVPAVSADFGW